MMKRSLRCALMLLLLGVLLNTMGCRYLTNRYYDFRDTLDMGVGVSTENSTTGIVPPALGLYFEATDFLHLGAISHYGPVAEVDLRGSGVYHENRQRLGFGPWQALHLDQDYSVDTKNYFKTPNTRWANWMKSVNQSLCHTPAKDLIYSRWAKDMPYGCFLRHRGYQYWEYMGTEAAICDPFFSHFGLYLRLGIDISEVSDFMLGWCGVDFKHDDMNPRMFDEFQQSCESTEVCAPTKSAPAGPSQDELDRLKAENDRLAKQLADVQGRLRELGGGIEIELPESVLFDTGKANLRPEGKKLLSDIAAQIKAQYPEHKVSVEGNTDNQPIKYSGWKSNWELGAARALTVLHYLNEVAGLPKAFSATTYADNKPIASNDTPEGRQKNRRSVIVLRAKK